MRGAVTNMYRPAFSIWFNGKSLAISNGAARLPLLDNPQYKLFLRSF